MRTHQKTAGPVRSGRHRQGRRRRTWMVAVLGGLAVAGGTLGTLALRTGSPAPAQPCARRLTVAAAPEIAAAVRRSAAGAHLVGCGGVRVSSADPAAVADLLREHRAGSRPDVWIPDSSLWLRKAATSAGALRPAASLAKSPIVLAVPSSVAGPDGPVRSFRALLHTAAGARPVLLVGAKAAASARALGVLASLYTSFGADPAERADLVALLRAVPATALLPGGRLPARPQTADGSALAVPTSEQSVFAADRAAGHALYTAVYPPAPGYALDYPFVTTATHDLPRPAARLLSALRSPSGTAVLQAAGFRSAAGAAGAALARQAGITARTTAAQGPPSPAVLDRTLHGLAVVTKPFRMLAVIDVSGSMSTPVPGEDGSTRMDMARAAAAEGLGLLPDGSSVGLWRFSADLTPSTDYQPLVPLQVLNPVTRGDLAAAIQRLHPVPDGGTGLYDTILAAVDKVRRHYDPTRVNSVVVLTDGKDEADPHHRIRLATLLASLRAEAGTTTAVRIVTIAYGPDSDARTLREIARASGGSSYSSTDPRDLPKIFRAAIGARLCHQAC